MELTENSVEARTECEDKLKDFMSKTIHIDVAQGQQCYWYQLICSLIRIQWKIS